MSDGMRRELAYLSSHATNRYFIPNWGKEFDAEMAKNAVQSTPDVPKRRRKRMMSDAEVITILICFHFNSYRNFKHYYQTYMCAFRTALE